VQKLVEEIIIFLTSKLFTTMQNL